MTIIKKTHCLLFLLLLLLPIGCRKTPPRQAIIILLDAARQDHFSCYGYERKTTPSIDALAETGLVFENCFTQATYTRAALPSFLYSRYYAINIFPDHHLVSRTEPYELFKRADDQCISFSKALELSGFLTTAISAHTWLKSETQFAREFTECFDLSSQMEFDKIYGNPRADQVIDFALDWLKRNSKRDFLLYLHLMETHFPHVFEGNAKKFFGEESYDDKNFKSGGKPKDLSQEHSANDVRYLNSLYDGSLHFADREIGRLIRFLKDAGRLDDTLLIITGDHGEVLLDRKGMVGHGGPWYDILAKVPLIIHYPLKAEAGKITAFSESIDVGPTLLGLLDVNIPEGKVMDGIDLLRRVEDKTTSREFVFSRRALRTDQYKCIFRHDLQTLLEGEMPRIEDLSGELYDVLNDPVEKDNLFASKTELVENLYVKFREKMSPFYERYNEAKSNAQPEFPFAISTRHFKTNLSIPTISSSKNPRWLPRKETLSGWLQEREWPNFRLYATRSAKPLEVSFEVPNGEYFLSADINGSCWIAVNGKRKRMESERFRLRLRWKIQNVEFGPVLIENNTFSATISPDTEKRWFGLHLFCFEPINQGKH